MIVDSLMNSAIYEPIHPHFAKAFDFLRNTDFKTIPEGKIELEGTAIYAIISDLTGRTISDASLETHQLYIDIQMPISAPETIGWKPSSQLTLPKMPYNSEKDITYFSDKASNLILLEPYQFAIFFPSDGHQPCIAEGNYRKVVIKIRK